MKTKTFDSSSCEPKFDKIENGFKVFGTLLLCLDSEEHILFPAQRHEQQVSILQIQSNLC